MLLRRRYFSATIVLVSASLFYLEEGPRLSADSENPKITAEKCFANPNRTCLFDKALSTAERDIKRLPWEPEAPSASAKAAGQGSRLHEIGKVIAKSGEIARAQRTLLKALQLVMKPYEARDFAGAQQAGADFEFQGIIDTIASVGDGEQANANLAKALILANSIDDAFERAVAVIAVAKARARLGDTSGAKVSAEVLRSSPTPPIRLPHIAKLMGEAANIPPPSKKELEAHYSKTLGDLNDQLSVEIATALAEAGQEKEALDTAEKIRDERVRKQAYQGIAKGYAIVGNVEKALVTAKRTDKEDISIYGQLWTLTLIAEAFIDSGNLKQAREVLDASLALASQIKSFEKNAVGGQLAITLARAGRIKDALLIVESIEGRGRSYLQALNFRGVAEVLSEMGDQKRAQDLLDRAIAAAREIEDKNRSGHLSEIADTLLEIGDKEQALSIMDEALQTAEETATRAQCVLLAKKEKYSFSDYCELDDDYSRTAILQAKAGEFGRAFELVDEIKIYFAQNSELLIEVTNFTPAQIESIELIPTLDWTLSGIAVAQAEAGMVEQALATAGNISSPLVLAPTFAEIGATLPP